jgi:multimeric flavodoxin WrbA
MACKSGKHKCGIQDPVRMDDLEDRMEKSDIRLKP